MKIYEKPMVEIEAVFADTAVADVETIVSFKDVDIWGGLFGTQD